MPVKGRDDESTSGMIIWIFPMYLFVPGCRRNCSALSSGRYADGVAPASRWRYLAIYEIESDDLKATMNESPCLRAGTARMPQSDAADHASSNDLRRHPIRTRE